MDVTMTIRRIRRASTARTMRTSRVSGVIYRKTLKPRPMEWGDAPRVGRRRTFLVETSADMMSV